jgi:DNA replication protein DnaC
MLDGFDVSFQPTLSKRRLRELADLSCVRTCPTVVFLGPAGTGTTHLSLALAERALTAGHAVRCTTLAELAQALESASHPGLMRQRLRRSLAPRLLVIDDVGSTTLSQEQAHHFFELVTARSEQRSIILTSHTSFPGWGALLGDDVLAAALLDRLLHHVCYADFERAQRERIPHTAEVLPMNGRSSRMKERQTGISAPPEAALSAWPPAFGQRRLLVGVGITRILAQCDRRVFAGAHE